MASLTAAGDGTMKRGPAREQGPWWRGVYSILTGISLAFASSAFGSVTFNTPSL